LIRIITQPNPLTSAKYLEVYAWEEMLNNSDSNDLAEARRMQKEGYLDCYVLVTCYHYDFYNQYIDFVKNNPDKVVEYYEKFLVDL